MENFTPAKLQESLDSGAAVFLKLWKKGCGACKLSIPAVERLEEALGSELLFAQISVDEFPEMHEIAETEVLPAFFVFKNKAMAGSFTGFKGLKALDEFVRGALELGVRDDV